MLFLVVYRAIFDHLLCTLSGAGVEVSSLSKGSDICRTADWLLAAGSATDFVAVETAGATIGFSGNDWAGGCAFIGLPDELFAASGAVCGLLAANG